MTEDDPAAAASATRALQLYRDLGDRAGQAAALTQIGFQHTVTDDYPAAAAELRQALELFRGIGHQRGQGDALPHPGHRAPLYQELPGRRHLPPAGAGTLQRHRLPAWPGRRPHRTGCRAATGRGLPGRRRLLAAGPGALPSTLATASCKRGFSSSSPQCSGSLATTRPQPQAASRPPSLLADLRDRNGRAYALNELGLVQQLTGDYPAAAACHQQALDLNRDIGNRLGQAETLNCLGELSSRTAEGRQARDHHAQALAIARDLGTPPEEARALEGIGHSHLRDGHASEAAACLRQALTIYQRIAAPAARRVQETLIQASQGNLAPER